MFEKIRKTTIDKVSNEIKKKTEEIADSLTDKISDVSEVVQNKTDSVSRTVGSFFESPDDPAVNIAVDVSDGSDIYDVAIEPFLEDDYGQQQGYDDEIDQHQESAARSYQELEIRRKKKKGKTIAATIAGVLIAGSAIGGASEYSQNAAMAKSYEQGVSYIMAEEYDSAIETLAEVTIEDSAALTTYAYVQSNIEDYVGKPSAMLEAVQEVDGIENTDVKRQQTLACEDLELAEKIQNSIDSLDLSEVNTISTGEMSEIKTQAAKLSDRYKILLVTDKYDLADRVLSNIASNNEAGQLISDIDDLGEITLDSKDDIEKLQTAYNNLTIADKETILNYSVLAAAANTYSKLQQEEEERIAAEKKAEEERIAAEKKAEEERQAAEKKAEEARLAAAASQDEEDLVWISGSGKKYHKYSSCSNMKNPWQVPRTQAESQGRDPCKKCQP